MRCTFVLLTLRSSKNVMKFPGGSGGSASLKYGNTTLRMFNSPCEKSSVTSASYACIRPTRNVKSVTRSNNSSIGIFATTTGANTTASDFPASLSRTFVIVKSRNNASVRIVSAK